MGHPRLFALTASTVDGRDKPAKGILSCIERATNDQFCSTGQPWVEPGQDERV